MIDAQLIGDITIIGILLFSAMTHGIVYYRMRDHRLYGAFALLCMLFAIYTGTNVIALYFSPDLSSYVLTSKLSSVFAIPAIFVLAWFSAEYIHDFKNIPIKPIAAALTPFFIINLFMENGILWSSIGGIEMTERPWGSKITRPVDTVTSWPMYALWIIISAIYILLVRAAFLALRKHSQKRGKLLFLGLLLLTIGYSFDMSIDLGINQSYFYASEYFVLSMVVLMSFHLTDELRLHAQQMEKLVSERTKELQRANDELKSFSYSVSHDLRAPLRHISGFLTILDQDYTQRFSDEAKELISKIFQSISRMEAIIEGMLNLSRITQKELQRKDTDISLLANEIINELKEKDPQRKLSFFVEENLHCFCDPSLIRILLENLISNSWKYTSHADDARITIKKYISDSGNRGFLISDNGVGFNEAHADKLFLPFQRLHTQEEFPGIGIGLATVHRIAKRHGGEIWAESKKDQGATFYVTF